MSQEEYACALRAGTFLHEYEIKSVLGMGNFGVTYLAHDSELQMAVAIKEYFPSQFAIRKPDRSVSVKSSADRIDYISGLDGFRREAQTLAHFDHPNIVRVLRSFEANNTSYMVMEFEEGHSLRETIVGSDGPPSEESLRRILLPLLDGLLHVHQAGFMHRDIKPCNIYLRKNGTPALLDFGSARVALFSQTAHATTFVTPGFTPLEQYACDGNQGTWSDIYALGGVFYLLTTGRMPVEAPARAIKDGQVPARLLGRRHFGEDFLRAIDRALAVHASKRLQSSEEWLSLVNESAALAR